MKEEVFANILVLESTALQQCWAVNGPSRDNNLVCLDCDLSSVLRADDADCLALADKNALYKGVLHELCAKILGIL